MNGKNMPKAGAITRGGVKQPGEEDYESHNQITTKPKQTHINIKKLVKSVNTGNNLTDDAYKERLLEELEEKDSSKETAFVGNKQLSGFQEMKAGQEKKKAEEKESSTKEKTSVIVENNPSPSKSELLEQKGIKKQEEMEKAQDKVDTSTVAPLPEKPQSHYQTHEDRVKMMQQKLPDLRTRRQKERDADKEEREKEKQQEQAKAQAEAEAQAQAQAQNQENQSVENGQNPVSQGS